MHRELAKSFPLFTARIKRSDWIGVWVILLQLFYECKIGNYLYSRVPQTKSQRKSLLKHAGRVRIERERTLKLINLPSFVSGSVSSASFVETEI